MTKIYLNFVKWFSRQSGITKAILAIFALSGIIFFVTWLLISNHIAQRIEDKETIKGLRLQIEVKDKVCAANEKRKDSIHQIEINNERLATRAWIEKHEKDQYEIKKMLLDRIAEEKAR